MSRNAPRRLLIAALLAALPLQFRSAQGGPDPLSMRKRFIEVLPCA